MKHPSFRLVASGHRGAVEGERSPSSAVTSPLAAWVVQSSRGRSVNRAGIFFWLRARDSNPRSPGYGPGEMASSPARGISLPSPLSVLKRLGQRSEDGGGVVAPGAALVLLPALGPDPGRPGAVEADLQPAKAERAKERVAGRRPAVRAEGHGAAEDVEPAGEGHATILPARCAWKKTADSHLRRSRFGDSLYIMKPHERRAANAYPYFKIAAWDERSFTWRDGKRAFPSEAAAKAEAKIPGKYRLSRVEDYGRIDLEPFEVQDPTFQNKAPAVPN